MIQYLLNFKKIIFISLLLASSSMSAQTGSNASQKNPEDTLKPSMNMDAAYSRPFHTSDKTPIAIGGYLEANSNYRIVNGIDEGFSFQMRRTTLFFSSTIARNIKFLSEIEFEDGAKKINLEFAAMDIEFHPMLNLRCGIIMNPIGSFNQNHDGPRWDFIERPLSSTTLIPATLSNVGCGIYGKYYFSNFNIGYEFYLTNGFDDKVISNDQNRTSLESGKNNTNKFEISNSGSPMSTAKIGFRNRKIGELGISMMTGIYNSWKSSGLITDQKRRLTVLAVDFNTQFLRNRISLNSEFAFIKVEVPLTYIQNYGEKQFGFFVDIVGTILQKKVMNWNQAKFNLILRTEYVDYNRNLLRETSKPILDDAWAIVPGISMRPVGTTVLRFNYRIGFNRDFLGNPANTLGVYQFGFSSYF